MKNSIFNAVCKTRYLALLTILILSIPYAGNVWGAEGDTHDFAQSLSQLLNNNASISSINIAAQSYPVKEVIISFRYNNTITNAVTMEVIVGGNSWGTAYSEGTKSNYKTRSFTHDAVTGAVAITFTNNTGTGTGHGTFYVNKVTLVEGAPSDPCTVTLMDDTEHPITETSAGAGVTLPSRAGCTGYTFAGWTASWTEEQDEWTTTAPSIIEAGAYSPSGDVNLYPVYTKPSGGGSSTVTFTPGTDTGATSVTKSVVTCTMGTMNNADYYQIYANGSGTFSVSSGNITAISFTCTNSNTEKYGPGNASANVGTYSYDGYVGSWSGSANSVTISATKQVRMEALSVTCTLPSTTSYISVPNCCTDPGLNYATGSVTKTYGDPAFTNMLTNSHSVAVTYALSNVSPAGCVSINASTGQVTINGAGSATITASSAAQTVSTVDYCADEASYTLTVNKANISPTLTYTPNSVAVGENSSAPTVGGNPGSGGVTYAITSATPAGCATINTSTGVVTGVAVGSVTVTATVAATNNYNGGTATANVTITAAAYFPQNKTLWFQAKSGSESAWKDGVAAKAWFRDGDSGGEAICTVWQVTAGTGKMYYAAVIPSTGNYRYMTLQRFQSCTGSFISDNGAVSKVDDGGSNVVESNGVNDGSVSWSSTALHLYLRGDLTGDSWASNIGTGEFADQGGGVWTYTYNNYFATTTSLDFKIYTNYAFWIGNTNSNSNATLSDLVVGSTYNITATYNVNTHALVMSKTPVNYQVHFDMNDHGSAISSYTTVTPNSTISAPSDPSESGWTFGGWFTDDACTTGNEWNFANDHVTETMTLHAKWTRTPVIKLNDATENITVAFGDKAVDATTGYTLSFTVSGLYLTENIAIGKSGTDQAMFTVSPSTVTQSEGTAASTTINVTYKPSTTGSHSATLTLSSAGAVDRTVTLSGTAKWKVVWMTNGGEYTTTLVDNNTKPTFPDPAPTSCESGDGASTTFIGWTKQKWTGKKNQAYIDALTGNDVVHVANTTMANVTDNTTEYHAVFALVTGGTNTISIDETSLKAVVEDHSGTYSEYDFTLSDGTNSYTITASKVLKCTSTGTVQGWPQIKSGTGISIPTLPGKITNISSSATKGTTGGSVTGTVYFNSSVSTTNPIATSSMSAAYSFSMDVDNTATSGYLFINQAVTLGQLSITYSTASASNYMTTCCENKVTLNTGSPSNGTVVFSPTGPIATCSSTASERQTTVTVTPNTGYKLTGWTKAVSGIALPDSTSAISTSSGNTAAQSNTYTFAQNANGSMSVTATFSPILVSSLKLKATQTGESDKIGDDLTMTCYPKEGQTGGNDPLNHSLNVKFHEVLPANALDKEYDWSVRVKATGAADWTNVGFTGNVLNNNTIINSYNKSTGNLQIKATTGTAEIKITAHDGSGVTAKVTITVANVSVSSISVDPTTMDVYAGQKKPVTITFSPANATDKVYTTGSYTYVTMRSSGSNPFYIEGNATNVVRNETVTVTSDDGSKTATIDVTVNPLPKATFIDIVHGKTDFLVEGESVLVDGTLTSTVSADGLTVDTEWHTPTHADVSDPGAGHNTCERGHLHLVGWILKDWADANPTATHSDIVGAGATNFYGANEAIDLSSASVNGKTYYAVWAKEVTTP